MHLNEALDERGVDVGDTAAVVAYLRVGLSRKAVKVSVYRRDTNQLHVFTPVSVPGPIAELPIWGRCRVFLEATAGKAGEFSERNRDVHLYGVTLCQGDSEASGHFML